MTEFELRAEEEGALSRQRALALEQRMRRLADRGQWKEAVIVGDALLRTRGREDDPILRGCVARTLLSMADCLQGLGHPESAVTAVDVLLGEFAGSSDGELRRYVAEALRRRASLHADWH